MQSRERGERDIALIADRGSRREEDTAGCMPKKGRSEEGRNTGRREERGGRTGMQREREKEGESPSSLSLFRVPSGLSFPSFLPFSGSLLPLSLSLFSRFSIRGSRYHLHHLYQKYSGRPGEKVRGERVRGALVEKPERFNRKTDTKPCEIPKTILLKASFC